MELAPDIAAVPTRLRVPAREESDGDLLQHIDAPALELLYRRYERPVHGLALRMPATATAPRTGCRRPSPRPGARPATTAAGGPGAPWLCAVARNVIVDRARARRDPLAERPDEASDEPG